VRDMWQGGNGKDLRIVDHVAGCSLSILAIVSGNKVVPRLHKDRDCETRGGIAFTDKPTMEVAVGIHGLSIYQSSLLDFRGDD
jgi:hypothetical protein